VQVVVGALGMEKEFHHQDIVCFSGGSSYHTPIVFQRYKKFKC